MQELRRRFGRLVAAHRRNRGLTQDTLAERSGVSTDMISRIEAGATGARFTTIAKLAEALDVDPAELFSSEVPAGARHRATLTNLTARLSSLSDRDLLWLTGIVDAALKPRG
ncbi:MAG: helix-turn-helix transcriptional regulator [Caulobacteraceae bacterium]|nr:helix-turn-helix transcriptional regulator [Caulobacteraceae bacterium]